MTKATYANKPGASGVLVKQSQEFPQPEPIDRPAPVLPNAEQLAAMTPEMREQVVKPLVDLGLRYKQAFGGWRLLADVLKAEDSTSLWAGAALMCRTAEDRRGTQFCTIMSVVAPSVRAEVLRQLK